MTASTIVYPIRATYGEVNRGHGLRYCSAPVEMLPSTLLDLTDKPPGHIPVGETWGPAVGCAPIGDWWALWWTDADPTASRAGMAISNVAIWPREQVGQIQDLGGELKRLNGDVDIIRPAANVVAAMAEMLIDQTQIVPVFGDLELWPGLLAALWLRLWPEARKSFSARVAISPPQHGTSVSPPLIFGVAKARIAEWQHHPIVRPDNVFRERPTRAVRWLIGEEDSTIDSLVSGQDGLGSTLVVLRRIARVADRIDSIRENPNASDAVDLLRTLQSLADKGGIYKKYQDEALQALLITLKAASLTTILSLANIELNDLPGGESLQGSVELWVQNKMFDLPFLTLETLLMRVEQGKAERWWLTGISAGIARGIHGRDPRWMLFLFSWLCEKTPATLLLSVGAVDNSTEGAVLEVALNNSLSVAAAGNLVINAKILGWSRIYALGIILVEPPSKALHLQLHFERNVVPGLAILVERLPAQDLMSAALETPDDIVVPLIVARTVREPGLIAKMDLGLSEWRKIWEAHVLAGGDPWPAPVDINAQAQKYLASVKTRGYRAGIISRLVKNFSDVALNIPDRASLWTKLDPTDALTLSQRLAELILEQCDYSADIKKPEDFVVSALITVAKKISLSARQLSYLLGWELNVSEATALTKMYDIRRWSVGSEEFGLLVHSRRWGRVARAIANYYRSGHTEALPALHACFDLLGFFDRWMIPNPSGAKSPSLDSNALVSEVALIGSELAHDRLDDIWARAGGNVALLTLHGTSAERWRKACAQAHAGMLPRGLLAIVRELRSDYENNDRLRVLEEILRHQE